METFDTVWIYPTLGWALKGYNRGRVSILDRVYECRVVLRQDSMIQTVSMRNIPSAFYLTALANQLPCVGEARTVERNGDREEGGRDVDE